MYAVTLSALLLAVFAGSPAVSTVRTAPGNPSPVDTGRIRLKLAPSGNEARYLVNEQLARVNLPSDAVGTTTAIEGGILLEVDGRVVSDSSRILIDLASITSDSNRRDNYIRRNTLETDSFPGAVLVPRELRGLEMPLRDAASVTFQLVGDLTLHGVTRSTTWDVTARIDGSSITGTAKTRLKFGDFQMRVPRVASVLSVEDDIRLEYDFAFVR